MPATLTPTPTKTKIDDLCPDCAGTLLLTDQDGSLTGTIGTRIPCVCVTYRRHAGNCPCYVATWPWNDGYTRWILRTTGLTTPYLRCPTHN